MIFFENLFSIAIAVSLIFTLWGIGFLILRKFSFKFIRIAENGLFSIGIGYFSLTNILFFIGLFDLINFQLAIILFIISFNFSLYAGYLFLKENKINYKILYTFSAFEYFIIISVTLLFLMNLIGSLAPPSLGDSMNHHLSAPKHYARIGSFPFVPISPWPTPGLMHVLYTYSIILSNGIVCQLLSCIFGFLISLSVFLFSKHYLGKLCGLHSIMVFYSLPLITELSTGAMVELGAFYCIFLSIWALIKFFESTKMDMRLIILSGLLSGCGGATKLWSLTIGPACIIAIIYFYKQDILRNPFKVFKIVVLYSISFNIILLPWFIRNYLASGNPIWPIGASFFDTQFYSENWALKMGSWRRGPGMSFFDFLMGPWNLTNNITLFNAGYGVFTSYLLNPLMIIFAPITLLFSQQLDRKIGRIIEFFAVFCLSIYIIWFLGGYHHPRYLASIYPFVSILTGMGIKVVFENLNGLYKKSVYVVVVIFFLFFLLMAFFINKKYFAYSFGFEKKETFLRNNLPHYDGIVWLNENLIENSKIFYAGTSAWYYVDFDYIPITSRLIDYNEMKTPYDLKSVFNDLGITHIFIEPDDFEHSTLIKFRNDILNDYRLEDVFSCQEWLNLGPRGTNIYPTTYEELRPFVLMRGLELLGEISFLKTIPTKKVMSRNQRKVLDSQVTVYRVN